MSSVRGGRVQPRAENALRKPLSLKAAAIDQVSGVATPGRASPTLTLLHTQRPGGSSSPLTSALGRSPTMGRAWSTQRSSPAKAHSMSRGAPAAVSMASAVRSSVAMCAAVRQGAAASWASRGRTASPPAGSATTRARLSPTRCCNTVPEARSTRNTSGEVPPSTTAHPRPGAASMTATSRRPSTGSAVKSTPAVVAGTRRCTTTAIETRAPGAWRAR
jgi:hypothetical protein